MNLNNGFDEFATRADGTANSIWSILDVRFKIYSPENPFILTLIRSLGMPYPTDLFVCFVGTFEFSATQMPNTIVEAVRLWRMIKKEGTKHLLAFLNQRIINSLSLRAMVQIISKTMTYVAVYPTSFGVLNETSKLNNVPQDKILAEVRGVELLDSILVLAEAWERVTEGPCGHVVLVSKTEGYELKIDVIQTIERFLLTQDPHLFVQLITGRNRNVGYIESVCILFNANHPGCAIADAIVSLVLLGESGWPKGATPPTLHTFTMAAEARQMTARFKLGLIELTQEDLEEINDIREALHLGVPRAAIDMLCGFARRCYACKGMEVDDVRLHIQGLLDEISERDLRAYAENPTTPSDLLFLPSFVDAV